MREHREWDETAVIVKAAMREWPITGEQRQLCVDKLVLALERAVDADDVAKIVNAFAKLHGQNQADRMSQQYIDAVDEGVQTRILAPSEVAGLMGSSIPDGGVSPAHQSSEHKAESKEQIWPNPPLVTPCRPCPKTSRVLGCVVSSFAVFCRLTVANSRRFSTLKIRWGVTPVRVRLPPRPSV